MDGTGAAAHAGSVRASRRSRRALRLSVPHEHGGYLTIVAAAGAGALVARRAVPAAGVGLVLLAAFLARGPLERRAGGGSLRPLDRPALAVLVLVAAAGFALVRQGGWIFVPALAAAAALLLLGALAVRRWGRHRSEHFEAAAMSALGASAGLAALAGAASWRRAVSAGVVLACQAGVSVPLVRTTLRPRERARASAAVGWAAVGLGCAGVALVLLARLDTSAPRAPILLLALVPRGVELAIRALRGPHAERPLVTGLREALELSAIVGAIGLLR